MSKINSVVDLVWPDRITLRDTGIYADEGQRIFTTATGHGYPKQEYVKVEGENMTKPTTELEAVAWVDVIAERQRQVTAEGWSECLDPNASHNRRGAENDMPPKPLPDRLLAAAAALHQGALAIGSEYSTVGRMLEEAAAALKTPQPVAVKVRELKWRKIGEGYAGFVGSISHSRIEHGWSLNFPFEYGGNIYADLDEAIARAEATP